MMRDVIVDQDDLRVVLPIRNARTLGERRITRELAQLGFKGLETREECRTRQVRDNALMEARGNIPQRLLRSLREEETEDFRGDPCLSRASHLARRNFRIELMISTALFFESAEEVSFLTVIDSSWYREKGELGSVDPEGLMRPVLDQLRRSRSPVRALCAAEACHVVDSGRGYWVPHVHGIISGIDPVTLRDSMRRRFRTSAAYRPEPPRLHRRPFGLSHAAICC